jgi:hypothetical protein
LCYPLLQIASRFLRAVGSGIRLALSTQAWCELGAPGAGAPLGVAATCPAGIFLQTSSRLLRAVASGIRLAPSMHDWRALGPAGALAAAVADPPVDSAGAAVLLGAAALGDVPVAAAWVLVAAGALFEVALEEFELDPPQAPTPNAISAAAMIMGMRAIDMRSSQSSDVKVVATPGFSWERPRAEDPQGSRIAHRGRPLTSTPVLRSQPLAVCTRERALARCCLGSLTCGSRRLRDGQRVFTVALAEVPERDPKAGNRRERAQGDDLKEGPRDAPRALDRKVLT